MNPKWRFAQDYYIDVIPVRYEPAIVFGHNKSNDEQYSLLVVPVMNKNKHCNTESESRLATNLFDPIFFDLQRRR
jgi:hypothetical protein